jgi:FkbM family methyltransferase
LRIAVENDGQGSTLYYEGSSEPDVEDTITRFLKEGMTFVDVGAHVGTYTLLAAQAVGRDGEVHAFEPNPAAFKLLELNLRLNGFSNVHAHPCAVADTGGTSELAIYAEATISSLAPREGGAGGRAVLKTVRTEVVRLDDLFALSGKRVDLVKVDVEGAELMVFRGARGLLERAAQEAPVWVFEYEPENYARFGYVLADLARFLRRYDYELWLPRPGGRAVKTDPLDVPRGVRNLLAAKKGTCLSSIL